MHEVAWVGSICLQPQAAVRGNRTGFVHEVGQDAASDALSVVA
jgi:hypothetical protein